MLPSGSAGAAAAAASGGGAAGSAGGLSHLRTSVSLISTVLKSGAANLMIAKDHVDWVKNVDTIFGTGTGMPSGGGSLIPRAASLRSAPSSPTVKCSESALRTLTNRRSARICKSPSYSESTDKRSIWGGGGGAHLKLVWQHNQPSEPLQACDCRSQCRQLLFDDSKPDAHLGANCFALGSGREPHGPQPSEPSSASPRAVGVAGPSASWHCEQNW